MDFRASEPALPGSKSEREELVLLPSEQENYLRILEKLGLVQIPKPRKKKRRTRNHFHDIKVINRRATKQIKEAKGEGYKVIDVTSNGFDSTWQSLSPMSALETPLQVPFMPKGTTSYTIEGIWEGLKLFPTNTESEEKKNKNKSGRKSRARGVDVSKFKIKNARNLKRSFRDSEGRQIPPLGHYAGEFGNGMKRRKLGYVEARRKIYLPTYKKALETSMSAAFNKLRAICQTEKVALLDYSTNGDVEDTTRPLSHAHLLRLYMLKKYPRC
ncbi:hypothetical protein AAMO2058_000819900 [Amorphochlora amoebiformis]